MTRSPDGDAPRYFGLYPAIVTDIVDPKSLGRIQLKFPWLGTDGERDVRAWATLLTPYADDDQGFFVLPAVDTQVVVGFEAGDLRRPYIVGSCWNGKEKMPEKPAEPNNKRLIKTRSGSLIELDDTDGAAKVTISMKSGHKVVLDDAAQEVSVAHSGGSQVVMNAGGQVEVTATATVEIYANAMNVHAATTIFDGPIVVNGLITTAAGTISPSYTPGAGNVW